MELLKLLVNKGKHYTPATYILAAFIFIADCR